MSDTLIYQLKARTKKFPKGVIKILEGVDRRQIIVDAYKWAKDRKLKVEYIAFCRKEVLE